MMFIRVHRKDEMYHVERDCDFSTRAFWIAPIFGHYRIALRNCSLGMQLLYAGLY